MEKIPHFGCKTIYYKDNISPQIELLIQSKPIKISVKFSLGHLTSLFLNIYEITKESKNIKEMNKNKY